MIKNKRYTATKKNAGLIPIPQDPRTLYIPKKCGDCIECRKQKAREWQIRMLEDIKTNTNAKFITLTFSNESYHDLTEQRILQKLSGYTLDNHLATRAMRLFNERWRKKYNKALRHWMVTEIGQQGQHNIHLHGIVWTNETYKTLRDIWKYGHIWPTPEFETTTWVNATTVNYIVGYITKQDPVHKTYTPIVLTSPGIGKNYTNTFNATRNKYNGEQTRTTYLTETGHKIALPIYWRNKIYSDEEREQLWLHTLNKNTRYVCGEKIDTSKTLDDYTNTRNWHRQRAKTLGYGNGERSQTDIEYEEYLRQIQHETRIFKYVNQQINDQLERNDLPEAPF